MGDSAPAGVKQRMRRLWVAEDETYGALPPRQARGIFQLCGSDGKRDAVYHSATWGRTMSIRLQRNSSMKYENAQDILPDHLLKE